MRSLSGRMRSGQFAAVIEWGSMSVSTKIAQHGERFEIDLRYDDHESGCVSRGRIYRVRQRCGPLQPSLK